MRKLTLADDDQEEVITIDISTRRNFSQVTDDADLTIEEILLVDWADVMDSIQQSGVNPLSPSIDIDSLTSYDRGRVEVLDVTEEKTPRS